MKYFAYIRKSSEDKSRQIQSIPKQYKWCKREAEQRGIHIAQFFEDSSSAHKLNRKGFKDMIETIEKSKTPVGIIVWKISRLARNPIDEGVIKYAFMRGKIRHIIARGREYKEHENQIIMGVDFGQATQFSIELSKDVKEGMNKKINKGYRPTKAPYGYINDPIGLKGEKKVFVDKKYFKPIRQFLKDYATGIYTVPELRDKLTEKRVYGRNGKPFPLSTLYEILKKRFYTGEYLWKGQIEKGKHKPMISIEEFERIQVLMFRKQKPIQNKYQNHYSGIIRCSHCQSAITGYSKSKNTKKGVSIYHYLKCVNKDRSCPQTQINRKEIDKQVLRILEQLIIPKPIVELIFDVVEQKIKEKRAQRFQELSKLQRKHNDIENELEVLGRKLTKGVVSDKLFLKMNENLEKELEQIVLDKKQIVSGNGKQLELLRQVFEFLNTAPEKFKNGSYEDKKIILETIGSNFMLNNGILSLDVNKAFTIVQKAKDLYISENRRIEPRLNRAKKGLKRIPKSTITGWSSWLEEIRTFFLTNHPRVPTL